MSRDALRSWAPFVLSVCVSVVAAGFFVARAVADQRVAPVETRVTTLEADQKRQDAQADRIQKSLDEQRADIKELLRRVRP